jgi:hypothetical protein
MSPRLRIRILILSGFHFRRQLPVNQNSSSLLNDEDISCADVPMQDSSLFVRSGMSYWRGQLE